MELQILCTTWQSQMLRLRHPHSATELPNELEQRKGRFFAQDRMRLYAKLAWHGGDAYKRFFLLEAKANGAAAAIEEHQSGYRRLQMKEQEEETDEPGDARLRSSIRISQCTTTRDCCASVTCTTSPSHRLSRR